MDYKPAGGRSHAGFAATGRSEEETMERSLRRRSFALLFVATLLAGLAGLSFGAPAMAAPREAPAGVSAPESSPLFARVLAWLERWWEEDPIQNVDGAGRATMDPDGESASSAYVDPGPMEPAAPQEGHDAEPAAPRL